jgi:ubiquinone/menaquinone biosynthesis C-methylase UbiE
VSAWLAKGQADAAAVGLDAQVVLVQGDLEALPVADGVCDLVWCRDTLCCVGDCRRMLTECARVLRPGGGRVLYAVFATDQPALVTGARDRDQMEAALGRFGIDAAWPCLLAAADRPGPTPPILYALAKPATGSIADARH